MKSIGFGICIITGSGIRRLFSYYATDGSMSSFWIGELINDPAGLFFCLVPFAKCTKQRHGANPFATPVNSAQDKEENPPRGICHGHNYCWMRPSIVNSLAICIPRVKNPLEQHRRYCYQGRSPCRKFNQSSHN